MMIIIIVMVIMIIMNILVVVPSSKDINFLEYKHIRVDLL